MATTLCEECFPAWEHHEVYTIVPMGPCDNCGKYDDRKNGGTRAHLFTSDPRKNEKQGAPNVK